MFDDILGGNQLYAAGFPAAGLTARPARGLAVVTCIDPRIEPLGLLGLRPGDATILRNAGARVTDDVLRSLVLAVNLLGVERTCIIQHTECALRQATNNQLVARIGQVRNSSASGWDFLPIENPQRVVAVDVDRVRSCPLLPSDLPVQAFEYDVATSLITRLDEKFD